MSDTYPTYGNAYPLVGSIPGYAIREGAQQENSESEVKD
jgi:hypothetical protein